MSTTVKIPSNLSPPNWGALGKIVFERSYSRPKADGTREAWAETVKRVVEGNCAYVHPRYIESYECKKLFHLIYNLQFIPAGRHLWATGIGRGSEFIANCHTCSYDPNDFTRHFTYTFLRLMEGGGVGSSYSNRYVRQYPKVPHAVDLHLVCRRSHDDYGKMNELLSSEFSPEWTGSFDVPDSREGWAEALGKLLHCYYNGEQQIVIDLTKIRPEGAPLKTFGGTASGPMALAEMLRNVTDRLNSRVGYVPNSELVLDIDHEIAKAVVAGGTRRSARMASKHWADSDILDFLALKGDGSQHWSANFSVAQDKDYWRAVRSGDAAANELLDVSVDGMLTHGCPGFLNLTKHGEGELYDIFGVNPCSEISAALNPYVSMPGIMACNLSSLNLDALSKDEPKLKEAIRLGIRFLMRATEADYPDPELRKVVETERRVGLGLMGFHPYLMQKGCRYSDYPHNQRLRKQFRGFYQIARESAREYAFELRIPEPVKVTTVAPTGTSSCLPGTTPGIQPIEFTHFIRRVRFSKIDPAKQKRLEAFEQAGFHVEDDLQQPSQTAVVEFPLMAPDLDELDDGVIETSRDLEIEQKFEVLAALQEDWADNSIAMTANFDPETMTHERLRSAVKTWAPQVKGLTVMPWESNIPQAPIEGLTEAEFYEYPEHLRQKANAGAECVSGSCEFDKNNIQGEQA